MQENHDEEAVMEQLWHVGAWLVCNMSGRQWELPNFNDPKVALDGSQNTGVYNYLTDVPVGNPIHSAVQVWAPAVVRTTDTTGQNHCSNHHSANMMTQLNMKQFILIIEDFVRFKLITNRKSDKADIQDNS
jgi:hypothetical protein